MCVSLCVPPGGVRLSGGCNSWLRWRSDLRRKHLRWGSPPWVAEGGGPASRQTLRLNEGTVGSENLRGGDTQTRAVPGAEGWPEPQRGRGGSLPGLLEGSAGPRADKPRVRDRSWDEDRGQSRGRWARLSWSQDLSSRGGCQLGPRGEHSSGSGGPPDCPSAGTGCPLPQHPGREASEGPQTPAVAAWPSAS